MSLNKLREQIVQSALALVNHQNNYKKLLMALKGKVDPSSERVLNTLEERLDAHVIEFARLYDRTESGKIEV